MGVPLDRDGARVEDRTEAGGDVACAGRGEGGVIDHPTPVGAAVHCDQGGRQTDSAEGRDASVAPLALSPCRVRFADDLVDGACQQ